jgi:hypothetical protein
MLFLRSNLSAKSYLTEGIIEVPQVWVDYFTSQLRQFYLDRAVMVIIYVWKTEIESIKMYQDKLKSLDKENLRSVLLRNIEQHKKDILVYKENLRILESAGAYTPNSVDYIDPMVDAEPLHELPDFLNIDIYPDAKDFKKYSKIVQENDLYLPQVEVYLDLMDNDKTLWGKIQLNPTMLNMDYLHLTAQAHNKYFGLEGLYNDPLSMVDNVVDHYTSTFKHEMIHYVQKRVLTYAKFYQDIDIEQYSKYGDYYIQTDLEFQPHIISAVGRFKTYIRKEGKGLSLNQNIADFVSKDFFFDKLKRNDKRYRKAISLFYSEIKKENL